MSQRNSVESQTDVPPYHQLLWPTIQALKALGDSGSNQEINDKAAEFAGLTDEQMEVLHGDGPMTSFAYRMAWARTYLRNVGALENTGRGVWAITEYGRGLTEADTTDIPAKVRAMLAQRKQTEAGTDSDRREHRQSTRKSDRATQRDGVEPIESITSTEFGVWNEFLLEALLAISPDAFERLCQRVLRESGFTKVEVTGKSGDGGIDGIGVLRVALLSFHVYFQCKRYRGSVGASAIRDFRGAMVGRTDKGLFITTGTFTADAKKEATRDGAPVLDLIDGEAFCEILKNLSLGVRTQMVEEVTVEVGWFRSL